MPVSDAAVFAFDKSIQFMPKRTLANLCKEHEVPRPSSDELVDYVKALTRLPKKVKLASLKNDLLAGRGSIVTFSYFGWESVIKLSPKDKLIEIGEAFQLDVDPKMKKSEIAKLLRAALCSPSDSLRDIDLATNRRASKKPSLISTGPVGEICKGMSHLIWSIKLPPMTIIDSALNLKLIHHADMVDGFYNEKTKILQVRSNATLAKKIAWQFGESLGFDPDYQMMPIAIDSLGELHKFKKQFDAVTESIGGDMLESRGFDYVYATRKATIAEDLENTEDYRDWEGKIDPSSSDISFWYKGDEEVRLKIGLKSQSIVFVKSASEAVYKFVFEELLKFNGLM